MTVVNKSSYYFILMRENKLKYDKQDQQGKAAFKSQVFSRFKLK
jgi:hypothetical protein